MNFRLGLIALLGCLAARDAQALIEHRVEKTFPAPAGTVLAVDLFNGAINVSASDSDTLEAVVLEQCDVATEKEAAPWYADLVLSLDQQGSRVVINASYKQKVSATWKNWPPVLLVLNLKVPRNCELDLYTRDGGITVGNLQGRLKLRNETGKIFTGEIDGFITVQSFGGDVALTACTGSIDVTTTTGAILVGRAFGPTRLASAGGAIEVQRAAGGVVTVGNGSEIKVRFSHPVTHASNLVTSGGSITAIFDRRSGAELDAQASVLGKVTVRNLTLPAVGASDTTRRSHLTEKLNGGGPVISMQASGGNILLLGEDPMPGDEAVPAAAPGAATEKKPVAPPASGSVGGSR